MINYFLQEDQAVTKYKTKKIIKQKLVKKKRYQPFHLDCQFSKKKICFCNISPVCNLSTFQKKQLWKTYQSAANFYDKITQSQMKAANSTYEKCVEKIRYLDKAEVMMFLKNLKMAKLSNFTNQSYQQANQAGYQ